MVVVAVVVVVEEMVVVTDVVVDVAVVTDVVVAVVVVTVVADLSHNLVTDTGLDGIRRLRIPSIGTSCSSLPFTPNTLLQPCPAFPATFSAS